jgi:NADH-quinone oxidoreductase subunit J
VQHNTNWWFGALLAVLTFGGLVFLLQSWSGITTTAAELPAEFDSISELGNALVSPDAFVLPFEVASVLLVAALIGAVYVAFNPRAGDSRK